MSSVPNSFNDLRGSPDNHPFARVWNKLLERLDAERIVIKPGLVEERNGQCRAIGLAPSVLQTLNTGGEEMHPWQIYQANSDPVDPVADWRTFTVHRGLVQGVWASRDDGTSPAYRVTLAASSTRYIWLKGKVIPRNAFRTPGTMSNFVWEFDLLSNVDADVYTLYDGASWPTELSVEYMVFTIASGEITMWLRIGKIVVGADEDDPHIVTITQSATDNILLTCPGMFPVKLTQTGGSAGSKDAACTFIYTVESLNDIELATSMSPLNSRARALNAPTTAATAGSAYYDNDGALVLWDANETLAQYSCPMETGGGAA